MKKSLKKGFTLVELVIVIAVIGILSTILMPKLTDVIESAKVTNARTACRNYIMQLETDIDNVENPDDYINAILVKGDYAFIAENGTLTRVYEVTVNADADAETNDISYKVTPTGAAVPGTYKATSTADGVTIYTAFDAE